MSNQQLRKLAEKRKQLDQQIELVRERQRAYAGRLLLQHVEQNPDSVLTKEWLQYLNAKTTRAKERELMGLPTANETAE